MLAARAGHPAPRQAGGRAGAVGLWPGGDGRGAEKAGQQQSIRGSARVGVASQQASRRQWAGTSTLWP